MALSQNDQIKLIKAGFTIIRADLQRLAIKHKSNGRYDWRDLEKGFASRAALQRRIYELLKDNKIILD